MSTEIVNQLTPSGRYVRSKFARPMVETEYRIRSAHVRFPLRSSVECDEPPQQRAQRAFLDPGGGRSVSDGHFFLSLPDSLKIAPSA
jgi:hypothetical protein